MLHDDRLQPVTLVINWPNQRMRETSWRASCELLATGSSGKIDDCNKFNKPGVYEISCNDSDYVGRNATFVKRYRNNISAWKKRKSGKIKSRKTLLG